MRPRCDQTAAWALLTTAFETSGKSFDLRDAFAADPERFAHFSQCAPHIFADLSKNLVDMAVEQQLLALARQCGVECYTGVDAEEIKKELAARLNPALVIDSGVAFKSEAQVDALCEPFLGGEGRADLAQAAKHAAKSADPERGLDDFLGRLPVKLALRPRHVGRRCSQRPTARA